MKQGVLIVCFSFVVGIAVGWLLPHRVAVRKEPCRAQTSATDGGETLQWLARSLDSGDPAAAGRVEALGANLGAGVLSVTDVDGVPVYVKAQPAWWYRSAGLAEIHVVALGKARVRYPLRLRTKDGQERSLSTDAEATRVYPLAEGLWRHHYRAYVRLNGEPVAPEAIMAEPMDGEETSQAYDELAQAAKGWSLLLGSSETPLSLPRPKRVLLGGGAK
jgi:hypothetical protein